MEALSNYFQQSEIKSWSGPDKLAPIHIDYHCYEDCRQSGCPGHRLIATLSSAVDIIHIDFGNGSSVYLDPVKMALVLHIAEMFNPTNKK